MKKTDNSPKFNKLPVNKPAKRSKNKLVPEVAEDTIAIDSIEAKPYSSEEPISLQNPTQRLNTLLNSRKSLSRLMRQYGNGHIDQDRFRSLVYSYNVLLAYWRTLEELEIKERLGKIETLLLQGGRNGLSVMGDTDREEIGD